jgi:hypothetical protein
MKKPTTEARRHGDGSGDQEIARDRVIGKAAYPCHPERVEADATASRRTPTTPVPEHAASGSSYEAANLTAESRSRGENQKPTTEARNQRESRRSSDFPDHPITCDYPITRSTTAPAFFKNISQTIRAALREIFDESAYDRFLLRTNASRSIASYRDFTRERDVAMLKKPRCC